MKKRYAVWGIDGSFRYKWVAALLRWWRTDQQLEQQKLINKNIEKLVRLYEDNHKKY